MRVPRLEELRINAFLTQDSLAARSGVSRDTISKLETGERVNAHARTVAKLASALNVESWQLQRRVPQSDDFSEPREKKEKPGKTFLGNRLRGSPRPRKVELEVVESEWQSVLYAHRRAIEQLPEDTPSEAILSLEWMALVAQRHGYEEARAMAKERVYGSEHYFREEDKPD